MFVAVPRIPTPGHTGRSRRGIQSARPGARGGADLWEVGAADAARERVEVDKDGHQPAGAGPDLDLRWDAAPHAQLEV